MKRSCIVFWGIPYKQSKYYFHSIASDLQIIVYALMWRDQQNFLMNVILVQRIWVLL